MIISGTPGTGKTTVSKAISKKLKARLVSLNDLVMQKGFIISYDSNRDTFIFDEKAIIKFILDLIKNYDSKNVNFLIVEGHFSDIIPEKFIDYIIVLRCHPDELLIRLKKKGYGKLKIVENIQAEILGNCVSYFINKGIKMPILEIDTTNLNVHTIEKIIIEIITEEKKIEQYIIGKVDWLENLYQQNRLDEFFD
ncbi:MAG: AAA family ATPase [Promethearchaeota archaeon]